MIWEILLVSLCIIFIVLGVLIRRMTSPFNPCYNQVTGQPYPSSWARPLCSYVTESYLDPSILTPILPMDVLSFTNVPGSNNGEFCKPVRYAFRYVRTTDGGYGGRSPWSEKIISKGKNSTSNTPTLGVTFQPPITYSNSEWILNIHRKVGDGPDQVVGSTPISTSPINGSWATFIDLGAVSSVSPPGTVCPGGTESL
jgi:hypothetical protein